MIRGIAIISIGVACLAGCSMAPEYTRPEAPVSATWPTGPAYKDGAGKPAGTAVADILWQDFFIDPQLRKVIALALENNRDLRIAALNIEKAQATAHRSAKMTPSCFIGGSGQACGATRRRPLTWPLSMPAIAPGRSGSVMTWAIWPK